MTLRLFDSTTASIDNPAKTCYLPILMNTVSLEAMLKEQKQPAFRLKQAKQAYFKDLADSWEGLSTWPKALRESVAKEIAWDEMSCEMIQESAQGDTVKFLFHAQDQSLIEMVIMRHDDGRNTVCLSCQVGCAMGCTFCATGTMSFGRNLTAEEMVNQVIHAARWLRVHGEAKVTNIVYMGMGEPMHNYNEVMRSIHLLNHPEGFGLGARHISISTCGVVPGILKLANEPEQVNLAISLHAPDNETRSKIMPVNKAYPVEKLMDAVRTYARKTNRKVMFEYLMLKDINDTREQAELLADILSQGDKHLYHVNVIAYHDTGAFEGTRKEGRMQFVKWLKERGVSVTHRRTFGEDIDAACGQLAVKEEGDERKRGKEAAESYRKTKSQK